jgi:ubiquitin-like domain-containing CTD phosphatase 1
VLPWVIASLNSTSTSKVDLKCDESDEHWLTLQFTWSGKPYSLDIADSDRVFDLKAALQSLTDVPPERQKILGLVKGKLPPDQARITDLHLSVGKKFTLIGTPEGAEIKDPSQLEFLPDVVNDLDVDFSDNAEASAVYRNDQRNKRKVKDATQKLQLNIIHPLRVGKKLLVLDIDYSQGDWSYLSAISNSLSLPDSDFGY